MEISTKNECWSIQGFYGSHIRISHVQDMNKGAFGSYSSLLDVL